MPFSSQDANAQIDASMNAMVLLNSSCQGVIEAEVQPVSSSWYDELDRELGDAETLVVAWRRSGVLSFGTDILGAIATCGNAFLSSRAAIDALFASLAAHFTPEGRAQLVALLAALEPPITTMTGMAGDYLARLRAFEAAMQGVQGRMTQTVAEVQAAEAAIQATIDGINRQLAALTAQVATDRAAIAQARSEETAGIFETIFGILLAPITGGASLILAGIGVATIAEAQGKIDGMEAQIAGYQQTIAGDQGALSTDQQIIATLNGLTMSTSFVQKDLADIGTALDDLRTSWTVLDGELTGTIAKLRDATSAADLVVAQAWYEAACIEWQGIVDHIGPLTGLPLSTRRRQVG